MNKMISTYLPSKITQNTWFMALWGVVLLSLTAQISLPLQPVPITLQTFGVLLIGLTFERKAAIHSITSYLAIGAMGAPVFAHFTGGIPCLLGPTAGYLFGFLFAVVAMSALKPHLNSRNLWQLALSALMGTAIILTSGVAWLAALVGVEQAMTLGLMPFILPGLIKAGLLAVALRYLKSGCTE